MPQRPLHPYTQVLRRRCRTRSDGDLAAPVLAGDPPSPVHPADAASTPLPSRRLAAAWNAGAARALGPAHRRVSPGDMTEDARRRAAELWQEGCRAQMAGELDRRLRL